MQFGIEWDYDYTTFKRVHHQLFQAGNILHSSICHYYSYIRQVTPSIREVLLDTFLPQCTIAAANTVPGREHPTLKYLSLIISETLLNPKEWKREGSIIKTGYSLLKSENDSFWIDVCQSKFRLVLNFTLKEWVTFHSKDLWEKVTPLSAANTITAGR